MRAVFTKKAIFFIGAVIILLLVYNTVKTVTSSHRIISDGFKLLSDRTMSKIEEIQNVTEEKLSDNMKYILQWTRPTDVPFVYMGKGQKGFIDRKCPYTNCIVTANRSYLGDYSKFHVIAFAGPEVIHLHELPKTRSIHQKYVFATIESSDNYPTCSNRFDRYFNWTWTFMLDSEVRWGYITIRDKNNSIVGPSKQMHWLKLKDMDPVSTNFKEQLKSKTKAAAWFVSNCNTRSRREKFVSELKKELNKYQMDVDIYGHCGNLKCSRDNKDECNKLIKKTYYFYLSFENSFSEDYATEKLLHALNNDAVPIVFGGANYSRFLPDGIYLNARELGVKELVRQMNDLINNPEEYFEYFKWHNHYSYHGKSESVETDPYCLFCTTLNDEEKLRKTTIYENFREWWDPPGRC